MNPPDIHSVDAKAAGQRLDDFLAERYPGISRMRLRQAVSEGDVRVDGRPVPPGWRLHLNAAIEARLHDVGDTAMTPEDIPLEVVYEDDVMAVVVKPAGMVMHPVKQYRCGTLVNALVHHFNFAAHPPPEPPIRPGLPHRLDRLTSGLVAVAKTREALKQLAVQFQDRRVRKLYTALVVGRVEAHEGLIDAPISRDADARPRYGVRPDGKPSQSRFRVLERLPAYTLLELEPLTGRTNQLRVHCAHLGHPIVGEPVFGCEEPRADPPTGRLFLHASRLELRHPQSREPLVFSSGLPQELVETLHRAR